TAKASSSKSYANNGTNIGNITLPDDSTYSMRNGGTAQVALNLSYLNSTSKQYTITYKSSDSNVFTVDSDGLITSVGPGTATLTVRMKKSNGKVYTMTCRIDVT
nr:Ig-like domain-containing protein [Pseudobutyrivibrio sp.]